VNTKIQNRIARGKRPIARRLDKNDNRGCERPMMVLEANDRYNQEKALIIANANDRTTPQTAPYINGYFMECYRSRTAKDW